MSTMYKYLPHTPEDIELMLRKVGAATLDDLFTQVPKELRLPPDLRAAVRSQQATDRLCRSRCL